MEKFFNTAGPNKPDIHYEIAPLSRFDLDEVLMLIRQQKYFVLHAPRQTGKTTCMLALRDSSSMLSSFLAQLSRVLPEQTAEYMNLVGAVDEGHLIIFDRAQEKTWEERIWHMPRNCAGRTIMVWGK